MSKKAMQHMLDELCTVHYMHETVMSIIEEIQGIDPSSPRMSEPLGISYSIGDMKAVGAFWLCKELVEDMVATLVGRMAKALYEAGFSATVSPLEVVQILSSTGKREKQAVRMVMFDARKKWNESSVNEKARRSIMDGLKAEIAAAALSDKSDVQ